LSNCALCIGNKDSNYFIHLACGRSEMLRVQDVAGYDGSHLALLLVEDADDATPVLAKLPLQPLLLHDARNVTNTADVTNTTDM